MTPPRSRALRRLALAAIAAAGAAGSGLAAADRVPAPPAVADPLAVLREPGHRWTFEIVHGDAPDRLATSEGAPRLTCEIRPWPAPGGAARPGARARLACAAAAAPGAPPAPALVGIAAERWLVFDGDGVRQLAAEGADPADRSAVRGLVFPRALGGGAWSFEATGRDGGRARATVRAEVRAVAGARRPVWIAEVEHRPPPSGPRAGEPDRELAVLAPGLGPVLLCEIDARLRPSHACLRLVEAPAPADPLAPAPAPAPPVAAAPPVASKPRPPARAPRVAIASQRALDPSTLTARAVVGKVRAAYLAGIRHCYASAVARDPRVAGKLALAFKVNAVGKTEAITAQGVDPAVAACVRERAGTWRFPIPLSPYAEPRTARFALGLVMSIGER